jgi:hypothetical protein
MKPPGRRSALLLLVIYPSAHHDDIPFFSDLLELGLAACAGILLAGARWVTGSIVPGLVAQGVLAVSAAMFIVLMGFSAM